MSENRMVRRSVVLRIIAIVVAVSAIVVLFTAGFLQVTYNRYVDDHHHTDEDYDSLNSQNRN